MGKKETNKGKTRRASQCGVLDFCKTWRVCKNLEILSQKRQREEIEIEKK